MSKVIDRVADGIATVVKDMGIELVEITYKKVMQDMHLTVVIDTEAGVSLNECEAVHRAIDPILDEIDPTDGQPYILNVSSPGLDRPLTLEWDYRKYKGKEVSVSLFEKGEYGKKFVATLVDYNLADGVVTLSVDGGTEFVLEIKNIALIKPEIKFS